MRRFELVRNKFKRFWQIETQGAQLRLGWGQIGTDGQRQIKEFPTPEEAEAAAAQLVAERISKGYWEVKPEPAETAREEDLPPVLASPPWQGKRVSRKLPDLGLVPLPLPEVEHWAPGTREQTLNDPWFASEVQGLTQEAAVTRFLHCYAKGEASRKTIQQAEQAARADDVAGFISAFREHLLVDEPMREHRIHGINIELSPS